MSRLRPLLRKVAYRSGALSVARRKSRRSLTVVMLHRVIDTADPDFASTDPTYTLSSALFEQLLGFLLDHYEIVGLTEVMAAYEGVKPLPDHALLITFDDGWADNLRYAAPLLRRRKTPAVVFTVAEAVLSQADAWWQEAVFAAARNGSLSNWIDQPQVRDILNGSAHEQAAPSAIDVVTVLGSIDQEKRDRLLLSLPAAQCSRRMMLKPDELRELTALGIDIALHGYNHVPLTRSPDVADELTRASAAISRMSGGTSIGTALGCPHGRYDDRVIDGARAAGVKLVFTSDPCLNSTRDGMLVRDRVLGRINVIAQHIEDRPGQFDPSAAARWLWAREVR